MASGRIAVVTIGDCSCEGRTRVQTRSPEQGHRARPKVAMDSFINMERSAVPAVAASAEELGGALLQARPAAAARAFNQRNRFGGQLFI